MLSELNIAWVSGRDQDVYVEMPLQGVRCGWVFELSNVRSSMGLNVRN